MTLPRKQILETSPFLDFSDTICAARYNIESHTLYADSHNIVSHTLYADSYNPGTHAFIFWSIDKGLSHFKTNNDVRASLGRRRYSNSKFPYIYGWLIWNPLIKISHNFLSLGTASFIFSRHLFYGISLYELAGNPLLIWFILTFLLNREAVFPYRVHHRSRWYLKIKFNKNFNFI